MAIKRILAVLLAIGVMSGGVALWSSLRGPTTAPSRPVVQAATAGQLTAKGTIVAKTQTRLSFKTAGRLAGVPVEVGQRVEGGQVLARLESEELELAVQAATDAVAIQHALLEQITGGARPEELVIARAAHDTAQARLNDLLAEATEADSKTAEQGVTAARAQMAKAESDLTRLTAGVDEHALRLAEQEVERAKSALWATQAERDGVKGNERYPEYMWTAADARVMAAEVAVQEAKTKLEQLRTAAPRPEEVAAAEGAIASARAALETAEARLAQLRAGGKPGEIAAARAAVATAKSQLELKQNGATVAEVEVARARVRQAETQLSQARATQANTELKSPHAGTVVAVSGRVGEHVTPGAALITLADLDALRVETTDLDEYAAGRVAVGRAVSVSINALPDRAVPGVVSSLAPTASINTNGDAVFTAVIDLRDVDLALRPGMTVKVLFGEQ